MELKAELARIQKLVEPVIGELLTRGVEEQNRELSLYQCQSGGKRIRPALLIMSGLMFGASEDDLVRPAAAVEILHNSTLIVDDIIDHSESRRDKPTCWKKFGKSMAECESLVYTISGFEGLADSHWQGKLTKLYGQTLKAVADGEIKDILFERSGREDEAFVAKNRYAVIKVDDYLDMIGKKTAILLKACCQAGAICADANEQAIDMIGDFGFKLGLAFQIRDDILDIFGDEKEFGKKIGKDIIEKKMGNIVILSALEKLSNTDREKIIQILESPTETTEEEISEVTGLIASTDAKNTSEKMADDLVSEALILLEKLPQNKYAKLLGELAQYVAKRSK